MLNGNNYTEYNNAFSSQLNHRFDLYIRNVQVLKYIYHKFSDF